MILALGEALMEFRRNRADGAVAVPGEWSGPFPSGAPAIFASVAARLGASTILAATVGDDRLGAALKTRLRGDGVRGDALHVDAVRPTALALVAYDEAGQRDFFFSVRGSAAMALDRRALAKCPPRVSWVHVSGSSLGFGDELADAVEAGARLAVRAGARLSLDPNLRPDASTDARERTAVLARQADVLLPSEGELDALGLEEGELLSGGALVCRTGGARGALLRGRAVGGDVAVGAPPVREVVDATGAGDTFAAALVTGLCHGASPIVAARRACIVAARSVTSLGAMEVSLGHGGCAIVSGAPPTSVSTRRSPAP